MSGEETAHVLAVILALASLWKIMVSPVLRDRHAAWEEIKGLKSEIAALKGEIRRLKDGDAE